MSVDIGGGVDVLFTGPATTEVLVDVVGKVGDSALDAGLDPKEGLDTLGTLVLLDKALEDGRIGVREDDVRRVVVYRRVAAGVLGKVSTGTGGCGEEGRTTMRSFSASRTLRLEMLGWMHTLSGWPSLTKICRSSSLCARHASTHVNGTK
jgi:hypothetical protein